MWQNLIALVSKAVVAKLQGSEISHFPDEIVSKEMTQSKMCVAVFYLVVHIDCCVDFAFGYVCAR
jgi:hypothetical protein